MLQKRLLRVLNSIWKDLLEGENIDIYIAILVGIGITLLDVLGIVNLEVTLPAILLTVTLLVFSLLHNRKSLIKIESVIKSLETPKHILKRLELPSEEFQNQIRDSHSVSLLGRTLSRFVPTYHADIEYALGQGSQLRILILDPEGPSIEKAAKVSTSIATVEAEKLRIQNTVEYLKQMKKQVHNADIEVRLLEYDAPYSITILKSRHDRKKDYCLVRIPTFKRSALDSPTIEPHPVTDKYWFDFFLEQFEALWKSAKELKL
jgi:hypothetical protein